MLKAAWEKAVHGYQSVRQSFDENEIAVIDRHIKDARQGYQIYVGPAPMWGGPFMNGRIELKPGEAAIVIAEHERERAKLVEAMAARREKYGLKP
jgi:hypothetical protein